MDLKNETLATVEPLLPKSPCQQMGKDPANDHEWDFVDPARRSTLA